MRPTKKFALKMNALVAHKGDFNSPADYSGYDLMLMALRRHKRELKNIQSNERKAAFKRSILPEFLPWIDGVLKADSGKQDDVLMTWLIWSIDCNEYQTAVKIAEYALKYDLAPPENFNRTLATIIAEEFATKALFIREEDRAYFLVYLCKIKQLTDEKDMPDPARAKLYKMIGLFSEENAPKTALSVLTRAIELDPYVGVKTVIKRLKKKLSLL
ncbi:TPA: phage terminase small subunit [Mannheimia haemolytica]